MFTVGISVALLALCYILIACDIAQTGGGGFKTMFSFQVHEFCCIQCQREVFVGGIAWWL